MTHVHTFASIHFEEGGGEGKRERARAPACPREQDNTKLANFSYTTYSPDGHTREPIAYNNISSNTSFCNTTTRECRTENSGKNLVSPFLPLAPVGSIACTAVLFYSLAAQALIAALGRWGTCNINRNKASF